MTATQFETIRVPVRATGAKTTWPINCDQCGAKRDPKTTHVVTFGRSDVMVCGRCWKKIA